MNADRWEQIQSILVEAQSIGPAERALESQKHLLLEDEPAWPRFLQEPRRFLATQ